MKGNPHAANVLAGITHVEDLIGRRELYQRDGRGLILEAQSRMAVAHELRTANLLKFIGLVPLSDEEYADRLAELNERLGHG